MIWVNIALAVCVVIVVAFLIRQFTADYSDAFMGAMIFGLIALILAGVSIGTAVMARHDETMCGRRAVQLERDVRFVRYSSFSWDCITPSEEGWVSLDRVIKAESSD